MPGRRHKPFKSKAQQRLFFANPRLRRYAKDKAHATGERGGTKASKARYAALPERVGSKRGTARSGRVPGAGGKKR